MLARMGRFLGALATFLFISSAFTTSAGAEEGRQIEEVLVTAERKEATVSDTSISITAFTGDFIEDFGIRNQEDLQNFIPAAVVEPYDMSIRGVGRNFRSLGGDPGVATYLNNVYSEDFGIASTEGGLYDIERIEVLRGPQGTLYGRNAIGGAINFVNKKPTNEFEGEARLIGGSDSLQEGYLLLSGPIVKDRLAYRVNASKRTREGYYNEIGPFGDDPDDYGDENYSLALLFTPTETLSINIRGNERSYARRMGAATAAGLINFNENGGRVDEVTGGQRNTSAFNFGLRAIDRTQTDPLARSYFNPGQAVLNYNDPQTGALVEAQRVRAGLDQGIGELPNFAFGHNANAERSFRGFDDLDGDDLISDTNGLQKEFFDHQAMSIELDWDATDWLSVKYVFGYTDYFYDRTSDDDLTSNTFADRQFYVSQESEYISHELQFFYDIGDNFTVTTGLFDYRALINQRGDFFDSTNSERLANPADYGGLDINGLITAIGLGDGNPVTLNSARGFAEANGVANGTVVLRSSEWIGDPGTRIDSGPSTIATDLEYGTRSERESQAVYTQFEWDMNEKFALTAGVRWARDELDGIENLFLYDEEIVPYAGILGMSLGEFNVLTGALADDGTGNPLLDTNGMTVQTGAESVRLAGIPVASSLYRGLDRADEEFTWRINLDYQPNDDILLYLSATTGVRSGGFNLVFFSFNSQFDPEELLAYELGFKGTLLDGKIQLNAAAYYYDYDNIHTFAQGPNATGGISTSVVEAPGAEIQGFDADIVWLATDGLTLGANFSFTPSEYTEDLFLIDANDSTRPESLFPVTDTQFNVRGNQLLRVPESKFSGFLEYNHNMGDNGNLQIIGTYSWISEVYFSPFENDEDRAPSYQRIDSRVNWTSADQQYMVGLFVNNITDEIGVRQIDRTDEEENFRRSGAVTFPRAFGLEFRYKFGAFSR